MVGGLHRPLVFEVGGVPDAPDDGAGARLFGKFAGQSGIDAGFDAVVAGIDVLDELLTVFDGQQARFRVVVADADDHPVEKVQRLVDQCGMASGEGVERPGEYGSSFHIRQR